MQSVISDKFGRTLIIEPGIGFIKEEFPKPYSLMTNYSLLKPESTKAFITKGDDRYERAQLYLNKCDEHFDNEDAWRLLKLVHQNEPWAH